MKLSNGIYAYCIAKFDQEEIDRSKLPGEAFFIQYRNIAAIVASVPKTSWQPTRKNILRHQKLTTRVQEDFIVLPLRFGVVFKDKKEVEKVLAEKYSEIKHLLNKVQGRVELGLRVFWIQDAFVKAVGTRKVEKLKKDYASGKRDRYMIALEAGKIVEAAVMQRRDEYVREIFNPLSKLADDATLNPVSGEKMVFNAAFLVKEQKLTDFDAAVKNFHDQYKDKFIIKYSGPWPPYNFVKVNW